MIVGVAIQHKNLTICLPQPNRHHDLIQYAVETLKLNPPIDSISQGFYTTDGTYLNRVEALEYVKKHGQPLRNLNPEKRLFSEDLW